ncbi:hypothetical protein J2Y46_002614 [Microbacterium sp. BE35]|uniref:hypothetical protein n=1 Tax=Microbacterium sp. BE35 TaxID=2817773 RepID=UPI0028612405|nr:hypothetical protein [Microbacterium sp. BE35]MDR7189788.1 hypothetical protein [Microbacterium sp. BE35]
MDVFGNLPDGLDPGSDSGSLRIGTVVGVNASARQVQVTVGASDPLWVPAAADIYVAGAKVRLERSPLDGGRAYYCLGALDTQPEIVTGTVTAVNAGTGTLTITCLGSSYTLPYVTGTYAVSTAVHVLRSLKQFGAPVIILGPQGSYAGDGGTAGSGGTGNPGQVVTRQATISPQWSGSWRSAYSRWDSWNTDRYGGRSTLWQGNGYGSGPMTGLATYGDQIVNLGATSITSMVVTVTRADSSVSTGKTPTVQPSSNGVQPGGAPSVGGATSSGAAIAPGQTTGVALNSSVFAGFLAGTYKGLATVGTDYAGFYGTARGDGMALTIQYTVTV